MKGVISIFAMPQELEDLALTLNMLKRNSILMSDIDISYRIEITMCLSDELTDWNNTKLPKEYIEDRCIELCKKYLDWCDYELNIETGNTILGCVSQRRASLKNNPDADFFIWLDCDFIFKDTVLYYMSSAYKMLKTNGLTNIILTPQFVKQWDSTWDIVVNERFLQYENDYELISDVYADTLPQIGDIDVVKLNDFKFAGGWFTLISANILNMTEIPTSLGHYGLEDTFVIECCKIMKNHNVDVYQFILNNLIIGESYIHRPNETIKKFIHSYNRKKEFTDIAMSNFQNELKKFYKLNYENIKTIN
jgi:hypothetical protein